MKAPSLKDEDQSAVDALHKVYLEPTSACNLACRTCVRNSWHHPTGFMSWETFSAVIAELSQHPGATVAFQGIGEPLLHPRLAEMVAAAHCAGLRTELTTNSLLLSSDLSLALCQAGLDQLVVSIDGCSEEANRSIREGSSLELVTANLLELQRQIAATRWGNGAGCCGLPSNADSLRVGIEFVAMLRNIAELSKLGGIARRIGASFVIVSNLLPYSEELVGETLYGGRATTSGNRESIPGVLHWSLPRINVSPLSGGPLGELLANERCVDLLDLDLSVRNNWCPFVANGSLSIAWDGHLSPCPPLLHSYSCYVLGRRKEIRSWEIGKVDSEGLLVLWGREDYREFRRRVLLFEFPPCTDCGGECDLVSSNEEDCLGNPFPTCGDCLWARGFIRCP